MRMAAGTYYPDQGMGESNNDRNSTFLVSGGVTIMGGYPAGGGIRDIDMHTTILSGDLEQNDINSDGNNIIEDVSQIVGGNAYSVVTLENNSQTATLSGLTITAGLADGNDGGDGNEVRGAGIYSRFSSMILEDNILIGNQSINDGAGLYSGPFTSTNELEIRRSHFISNAGIRESGGMNGAGFHFIGNRLVVSACHFENNYLSTGSSAFLRGFAFSAEGTGTDSSCIVVDCLIINNRSGDITTGTPLTVNIGWHGNSHHH